MKIVIDPQEARRFARFLDERGRDLSELNRRVSLRLQELGLHSWKDARYSAFLLQFDEASTLLKVFLDHAEKYAEYLRRKAAPVERYLERR